MFLSCWVDNQITSPVDEAPYTGKTDFLESKLGTALAPRL